MYRILLGQRWAWTLGAGFQETHSPHRHRVTEADSKEPTINCIARVGRYATVPVRFPTTSILRRATTTNSEPRAKHPIAASRESRPQMLEGPQGPHLKSSIPPPARKPAATSFNPVRSRGDIRKIVCGSPRGKKSTTVRGLQGGEAQQRIRARKGSAIGLWTNLSAAPSAGRSGRRWRRA